MQFIAHGIHNNKKLNLKNKLVMQDQFDNT